MANYNWNISYGLVIVERLNTFVFCIFWTCYIFSVLGYCMASCSYITRIYIYISVNQNGGARGYCFRTLKIIFVVISPSFIRTKFDNKHVLIE